MGAVHVDARRTWAAALVALVADALDHRTYDTDLGPALWPSICASAEAAMADPGLTADALRRVIGAVVDACAIARIELPAHLTERPWIDLASEMRGADAETEIEHIVGVLLSAAYSIEDDCDAIPTPAGGMFPVATPVALSAAALVARVRIETMTPESIEVRWVDWLAEWSGHLERRRLR